MPDGTTYYVEVSNPDPVPNDGDDKDVCYQLRMSVNVSLPDPGGPSSDSNTSYDTAVKLGTLGAASTVISGVAIGTNDAIILDQPGGIDEPGHRHINVDGESHLGLGAAGWEGDGVIEFNFNPSGGWNQISETQKDRAREIFELYSYYLGVQFVETASSGIRVATGDLRTLMPNIPPGVGGLGGPGGATMNAAIDWGVSEYGGSWFNVAVHEIGHALGLDHAYDIVANMGSGGEDLSSITVPVEAVYPRDNDLIHLDYILNSVWNEIDLYQFQLTDAGVFTAETQAERLPSKSTLDTQLVLYREVLVDGNPVREIVARNDDYYSNDSLIELELQPGTYYVGVMSTGLTDFDPTISDSGFGGKSTGGYELNVSFAADSQSALVDATETPLDGDADGVAGGVYDFWFQVDNNTVFVDKATESTVHLGTIDAPFAEIDEALEYADLNGAGIVRVVGNADDTPYLVGYDNIGSELADGDLVQLPEGVTMMVDAGAVFKLQSANIEVGSSSQGISLANAALQVLGIPGNQVHFRSFRDDSIGGDSDGSSDGEAGGDWGGLVFRADSDYEDTGIFLNSVAWADIQHGGGKVTVGTIEENYTPVHMEGARPAITCSVIQNGAGGAISADLASFEESMGRIGPDIHGNTVLDNTLNGLFVRIPTPVGGATEKLQTAARWDDTDIIHIVTENLFIEGTPGGPAQQDARLRIDPAVVVKLEGARIHTEFAGQLIAEGLPGYPVVFTSLKDDTYGMAGNFDASNDGNTNLPQRGQWGGLIFAPTSHGSLDHVQLSYAGGETSFEGDFDTFNPIEIHQADVRIANSVIELNAGGNSSTNRNGLGTNTSAAIFVRGAQPVIVNNKIVDNQGDAISINANAMRYEVVADPGRSTGAAEAFDQFGDNRGPLVRLNVFDNTADGGGSQRNGMVVRGEFLTAESIWDDTDVVHILRNEIYIPNLHTYGGLRLQSSEDASLVVKLDGTTNAGFTVNGETKDVEDRIGGTLQILGTADYPVVLTSLHDDTAAAGFDLNGDPQGDTDAVVATPHAGDWRSVIIDRYANTRNVAIANEVEPAYTGQSAMNDIPKMAQYLGQLAPDFDPSIDVTVNGVTIQGETDDEKGGDETQRLGFEVQGTISLDDPTDQDVYSFTGTAGTEVWIDLDRTSYALDAKVELVLLDGVTVIASSSDAATFGGTGSTVYNPGAINFNANQTELKLDQEAYLGHDFYGTNPLDPGMHVVLPGTAGAVGTYFVRVTSENGTSGRYQMQIRLRQVDEFPGSTVRYADIRYATNGIEVYGQPAHSILAAETGETSTDNNTQANYQNLGNLLTSDLNAVGVSGYMENIANRNDSVDEVDWYRVQVRQDGIQSIGGINNGAKTWATVFDIDYADALSGVNLILSVYDSAGRLIYIGYDSNIEDDLPAAGENGDEDDLSRGSFSTATNGDYRDPFIGPVQLPANTVYYVAVSSNQVVPTELNQTWTTDADNPNVRIEPIDSVRRLVEDHIGFNGYTTGDSDGSEHINPVDDDGVFHIENRIDLQSHVVPYTLSDVVLYVSTNEGNNDRLRTVNPFTGSSVTDIGQLNGAHGVGDIAMRADGVLMGQLRNDSPNDGNTGDLKTISTEDAGLSGGGSDGLTTDNDDNSAVSPDYNRGDSREEYQDFQALAFRDMGTTSWEIYAVNNNYYDENTTPADVNDGVPALWRIDSDGTAHDEEPNNTNYPGSQPVGNLNGIDGRVTGLEFVGNRLIAVTDQGTLYYTTVSGSGGSRRYHNGWTEITPSFATPAFTGLTLGPQSLDVISNADYDGDGFPDEGENGTYELSSVFFASSSNRLYAFTVDFGSNTATDYQYAFDSDGDGWADASSIGTVGGITGLAFSPLSFNLWHPTQRDYNDSTHGIPQSPDASRNTSFSQDWDNDSVIRNDIGQRQGGASFYFGLEQYDNTGFEGDDYLRYRGNSPNLYPGSEHQYGIATNDIQQDLTSNGSIGNNYNTPGGAHGSLITDTFDLSQYDAQDRPTLYFTYYLDTQGRDWQGTNAADHMLDSARVWVWDTSSKDFSTVTSGGNATTIAKAIVSSPGDHNDFLISFNPSPFVDPADYNYLNDLPVIFNHVAGIAAPTATLSLDPATAGLVVTYEWGVSTANDIISAINDAITDAEAQEPLLGFLGTYVQLLPGNNGSGTVQFGGSWKLGASNNSTRSFRDWDSGYGLHDLPNFLSHTTDASTHRQQGVQELFDDEDGADSTEWRQARVDLSQYAGQSGLRLRFDFSTAGRMPDHNTNLDEEVENDGYLYHPNRGRDNNHEGFYIDDIIIGFAERGEMVTNAAVNTDYHTYTNSEWNPERYDETDILEGPYQLEIRRGSEYAQNVLPETGNILLSEQFNTNARLIPGGGDWVATSPTDPLVWTPWPVDHLVAAYVGNYRGDQNVERQQDQLIIEKNTIRDVDEIGILIDAGNRDGLEVPQPGSAINFPVLNNQDLAPGVVVSNNVVAYFGDTGIFFSGDDNQDCDPVTPFGRIVNNTIVGTSGDSNIGIEVTDYASPTILNNIVTTTTTGISISGNSNSTVYNYNLYQGNGTNLRVNNNPTAVGTYGIQLASGAPVFVNSAVYNFYLAAGSLAIDSSIDSLSERTAMKQVKDSVVIPLSPIIAPDFDRYNQKRLDDKTQTPPSGMGANIYKDRGAIERADFAGPTARVVDPYDNADTRDSLNPKIDGYYDYNGDSNDVVVINQKTTDLAVQLFDTGGIGIDDSTILTDITDSTSVDPNVVTVYRAPSMGVFDVLPESQWPTLELGNDYLLEYDTINNILHVLPATGVWESGAYYVIDVNNNLVRDLADNTLQPNRNPAPFTGKTLFTIQLTGLDFGDLPDSPYVTLLDSGPVDGQGGARHVVTGDVYLGSRPNVELDGKPTANADGDLHDDGIVVTSALLQNGQAVLTVNASTDGYLNAWIDYDNDGKVIGTQNGAPAGVSERIFENEPLAAGLNTLTFALPDAAEIGMSVNPGDAGYYLVERFARFRFTSQPFDSGDTPWLDGGAEKGFTGLAYDGEVEDYMFDVVRYRSDWGDAPSDPISGNYLYPTLAQLNGASHFINGPYLGWQIDAEVNGQPTIGASGDDLDVGNDGTTLVPASFDGTAHTTDNGSLTSPASIGILAAATSNAAFTIYEPGGTNGILVQFTNSGTLNAVWDEVGQVLDVFYNSTTTSVNDLLAEINGTLGCPLVAELVGDEDGVTFAGHQVTPGNDASQVEVVLTNAPANGALLEGWIDFNGDGAWADEYAYTDVIDPEGMHNEFSFIARDPGQVGTRVGVVFNTGAELSATYDVGARTLNVVYVPGVSTLGDLAALVNKGTISAAEIADRQTVVASAADAGSYATHTFALTGYENDFAVTATDVGPAGDFAIRFVYTANVEPTLGWDGDARTLDVNFLPGATTVESIVAAINDAGLPVAATMAVESVNAPTTLAGGTGTLSGFDLAQTYNAANGAAGVHATTGTISMRGYDNDFVIAAATDGAAGNFMVDFAQAGAAGVNWDGTTLTLSYEPGVTTAADLVAALNSSGEPFVADLVTDLPMKVVLDAAATNDGSGTIAAGDLNLVEQNAQLFITSGGSASSKATTGPIDPPGDDNGFEIIAKNKGGGANAKRVVFYDAGGATESATWNGLDTLTIQYNPGVTTVNQILDAVNNSLATIPIPDGHPLKYLEIGCPFEAKLVLEGTGTIASGQYNPGDSVSAIAPSATEYATTGPLTLTGDYNDFQVTATVLDTPGNFDLIFDPTGTGTPTAAWDDTGATNTVTVQYEPDVATVDLIIAAINTISQVKAVLVAEAISGTGTIAQGDLADGSRYITAGGDYASRATTGVINPPGISNAFEILGIDEDPSRNGITITFSEVTASPAVNWNGLDTLSVSFVPGVSTVADIILMINGSTAPLEAVTALDPNAGAGLLGDVDGILDGAEFTIDGAYERIFTNEILGTSVSTHTYFVPENAAPGDTYARFRVTTDGVGADGELLGPGGHANTGEVEDYLITIQSVDYGDAGWVDDTLEDPYQTALTRDIAGNLVSDGARHVLVGPMLGTLVDHDSNGLPTADALGDDLDSDGDDEDGVIFVQEIVPGQSVTVNVTMDRDGFEGRASVTIDPAPNLNDAFVVRAAQYGDTLNGTVVNLTRVDSLTGGMKAEASYDLTPPTPTLTVNYVVGATTNDIIAAINNTGVFAAERNTAIDPTNDGSFVYNFTLPDTISGTLAGGQWPGFLYAWIDFNQDGVFDDGPTSEERIFTNVPLYDINEQVNTLTFDVPSDAKFGETYVRFRVSADGLAADGVNPLGPNGLAMSGEVEDYLLLVRKVDYGDAPYDAAVGPYYPTKLIKDTDGNILVDGARHVIGGPHLGVYVDHDLEGMPSALADGDDLTRVNDGSETIAAGDLTTGTPYVTFAGIISPFTIPGISNDFSITAPGGDDGINVVFEHVANTGEPAKAEWNGSDTLTVTFEPGVTPVSELVTLINEEQVNNGSLLTATLIDDPDNDDEDGLDFAGALMIPGETTSIDVTISEPGYLDAWIDYNADGQWDSTEHVFGGTSLWMDASGSVEFDVPDWAVSGTTYARFRISSAGGLSYDGIAPDGEVEDYMGYIQEVDYGDAPPAMGYPTLPADGGPRHYIGVAGPWYVDPNDIPHIGATSPDHDLPLAATPNDDDTITGVDDEDESDITFYNAAGTDINALLLPGLVPGEWASVDVSLAGTNPELHVWIDFNGQRRFQRLGQRDA